MEEKNYKFETIALHAGQEQPDPATDARAVPIYMTTSYVFKDSAQAAARFALEEEGNIYTRLGNPTTDVFEKRMAALEGGVGAVAVASGSAAITYAIQNIATAGDHIVAASNLYGGTTNLLSVTLPEQGITTTFVDQASPENFRAALRSNTKLIYAETMGNPNSDLIDLEAIAAIAHENGIPFIVDNTFATPYLIRPIEYGADIVVHSATKFIGGHGTAMGGVVVDSGKFDWTQNDKFPGITKPNPAYHGIVFSDVCGNSAYITKMRTTLLRDQGAVISPFNSFLLLQGLETLSLRVERHVENALKVVDFLKNNPMVEKVNHPSLAEGRGKELYEKYLPNGGGSIFSFEMKGGKDKAILFTESLQLFSLLANVADVKSLVIHPASTTHSQLDEEGLKASGITEATVRLSIGTEHIDDIIADLQQAFKTVEKKDHYVAKVRLPRKGDVVTEKVTATPIVVTPKPVINIDVVTEEPVVKVEEPVVDTDVVTEEPATDTNVVTEEPTIINNVVTDEITTVTPESAPSELAPQDDIISEPAPQDEIKTEEIATIIPEPETVASEPAVTSEPVVTEEPAVTSEPIVTEEPAVAEEPAVTSEPVVTEEPSVSAEPIATEEPATVTSEPVAQSDVATEASAPQDDDATEAPATDDDVVTQDITTKE